MNVEYLSMFGSSNKSNKYVVDYLAIKVDVTDQDTPYYTIIYHPINSEKTYEGYGTSNPFIVNQWLEEYFIVQKNGDIE